MRVIYTVPHASTGTAAGDKNSLKIALALRAHVPGKVLVPRDEDGTLTDRIPGKVDHNREFTPWPRLKAALLKYPTAVLVDVHTYGRTPKEKWNIRGKPDMVVMSLDSEDQKKIYDTYFKDFPQIQGSDVNRNVKEAASRAVLLEFNEEIKFKGESWERIVAAVTSFEYSQGPPQVDVSINAAFAFTAGAIVFMSYMGDMYYSDDLLPPLAGIGCGLLLWDTVAAGLEMPYTVSGFKIVPRLYVVAGMTLAAMVCWAADQAGEGTGLLIAVSLNFMSDALIADELVMIIATGFVNGVLGYILGSRCNRQADCDRFLYLWLPAIIYLT